MEEESLYNKLVQGLVRKDGPCLVVKVRRPVKGGSLSISLLQANIGGSPAVILPADQVLCKDCLASSLLVVVATFVQETTVSEETAGPNSTCFNVNFSDLDLTSEPARRPAHKVVAQYSESLDQSDYNSLDMTNRARLPPSTNLQGQVGGAYASPMVKPSSRYA